MGNVYLDPRPGKLHGFLKDIREKKPIENATIVVTGNSALSSSDGEFVIDAEVGKQKLMIYHPDFETLVLDIEVKVNSYHELGDICLSPKPGTVIGSTVPGRSTIRFYGKYENYSIVSDENGDFIIHEIIPDTYLAEISCEGYYTKTRKNIIILSGDITDMGITVLEPEVGNISGKIVREDWVAIENASVTCTNTVVTDEYGTFFLSGIKPGIQNVFISANGFESKTISCNVIANETVDLGTIVLEALESGRGNLVVQAMNMAGEPISATITLLERNESITTVTENNYTAKWEKIPKGPYTVRAEAEGYFPYIKDAVVISDQTTTINFNLIDRSKIVDDLVNRIDELEHLSTYWDKEIGYPVEERYTLGDEEIPMKYRVQYNGPEDIYVGTSLEDPNSFFDLVDEKYGELFDAQGNPVKIIGIVDENGDPLPRKDSNGRDIKWYGKGPDEEVYLILSAIPKLPEGLTDIIVRYAIRKTLKDLAVDALIKRGVTAKEVDVSVIDTISQLKGAGFAWNEPIPEDSTIIGLSTRVSNNEGKLLTHQTLIEQNAEQIGLHATRIESAEERISATESALTIQADEIESLVSRMDTAEGEIEVAQSNIKQNADRISSTVRNINIDRGSYLKFNGENSWIDFGVNPGIIFKSIKARVMFEKFSGQQTIFSVGETEFGLQGNNLCLSIEDKSQISYNIENLETGKWYDLEGIIDGDSKKLYLKIDGVVATEKEVEPFIHVSSGQMKAGDNLKGYIDEIQVWSTYSLEGLIEEVDGTEEGLIYAWPLNEHSGNVAHDITGKQNGIIYNCKWHGLDSATSRVEQLSNQYTVKITRSVDGKEIISGFGLISGDDETEFTVVADRFYIFGDIDNPDEIPVPVFAVDAETGKIYIEADLIANGSITGDKLAAASLITQAAQIEKAIINTAHIDYLDLDSIDVRGRLAASHIIVDASTQFGDGYDPTKVEEKLSRNINELNSSFLSLGNQLDQFINDKKLTRIEAEILKNSYNNVKSEWQTLNSVASSIIANSEYNTSSLANKRVKAENAISELELELNNWIDLSSYPVTITESDKNNITTKFNNVQNTKVELLNEISKYREDAAIAWAESKINTAESRLKNEIDRFSDDNVITRSEANSLETSLNELLAESEDLIETAKQNNIITIRETYENALADLEAMLTPWFGLDSKQYPLDLSSYSITREDVINQFALVQKTKIQLLNAITNKKTEEAIIYTDADIVDDITTHIFHFDKHLTSTKGIYPQYSSVSIIEGGGRYGGALELVPGGRCILDMTKLGIDPLGDWTIAGWFKRYLPQNEEGSWSTLFHIGDFKKANESDLAIWTNREGSFQMYSYDNLSPRQKIIFEPEDNELTDWFFVGITHSKQNNLYKINIFTKNREIRQEWGLTYNKEPKPLLSIGCRPFESTAEFNGLIDELLVSKKIYSNDEINRWAKMNKPFHDNNSRIIPDKPTSVKLTIIN